jgi:CheY-like chemotaxis protein
MKRLEQTSKPMEPEKTVLYVEDEESNWEVTELRLRKHYKLLWARTDVEACALVRQYGSTLHAVLMDVQLKGSQLDGIQLTKLLRGKPVEGAPDFANELPAMTCPIFFVTAYGNLHSNDEFNRAGGDAHVPKPVDFVKLSLLLARSSMQRAMDTLKR